MLTPNYSFHWLIFHPRDCKEIPPELKDEFTKLCDKKYRGGPHDFIEWAQEEGLSDSREGIVLNAGSVFYSWETWSQCHTKWEEDMDDLAQNVAAIEVS